jgi:hypothetical protein
VLLALGATLELAALELAVVELAAVVPPHADAARQLTPATTIGAAIRAHFDRTLSI